MAMYDNEDDMLVREEGEKLHAYRDHLGYLTIGVGHLIDERVGGSIPQFVSRWLLSYDKASARRYAERYTYFGDLDTVRQAAIVSMMFQMGPSKLAKFVKFHRAMARKDYDDAHDEGLDSVWARQTPKRARRMMYMIKTGRWPEEE